MGEGRQFSSLLLTATNQTGKAGLAIRNWQPQSLLQARGFPMQSEMDWVALSQGVREAAKATSGEVLMQTPSGASGLFSITWGPWATRKGPFCGFSRCRLETLAATRAEDRERPPRVGWGASCPDCFVPCPGFLPTAPRPSTAEPRGAQDSRAQEAAQTRVGCLKAPRQQEEVARDASLYTRRPTLGTSARQVFL